MKLFATLADVQATMNTECAVSDWLSVTQTQIQLFADATHDQQWIHTDPTRAAAGPFGAPIAHGFLTLSLLPALMATAFKVEGVKMGVNYGLNKVRFVTPVRVGSRVRARFTLLGFDALPAVIGTSGGAQMCWQVTIDIEGETRPACVAESLVRSYV